MRERLSEIWHVAVLRHRRIVAECESLLVIECQCGKVWWVE